MCNVTLYQAETSSQFRGVSLILESWFDVHLGQLDVVVGGNEEYVVFLHGAILAVPVVKSNQKNLTISFTFASPPTTHLNFTSQLDLLDGHILA